MGDIVIKDGGVIVDSEGNLCQSCCVNAPMLQHLTNAGGVLWSFDIRSILPDWSSGRAVFRLSISPSGNYLFVETPLAIVWGSPATDRGSIFMLDITTNPPTVVDFLNPLRPISPLRQFYISASDDQLFISYPYDYTDHACVGAYGYDAGGFTGVNWKKALITYPGRRHIDCWDTSYRDGRLYVVTRADYGAGDYYNFVSRLDPSDGAVIWGPNRTGGAMFKPQSVVAVGGVGGADTYLVYGRTGGDAPLIERWTGEYGVDVQEWTLDDTDVPEYVQSMANNSELDVIDGYTTPVPVITSKLITDSSGAEVDDLGIEASGCDIDGGGNSVLYDFDEALFKTFDSVGAVLEEAGHKMEGIPKSPNAYPVKFTDTRLVAAYAAGTTYAEDALCKYGGTVYISLHDGNIGNQPDISPTDWVEETFDLTFIVGGTGYDY